MKQFYANPDDDLSAVMQDRIFACRHEQYMNALAHIFNTGRRWITNLDCFSLKMAFLEKWDVCVFVLFNRDFFLLFLWKFNITYQCINFWKLVYRERDKLDFIFCDGILNFYSKKFILGQGVVLERSVYSDFVFVNAMRSKNFIGPECRNFSTFMHLFNIKHLVVFFN